MTREFIVDLGNSDLTRKKKNPHSTSTYYLSNVSHSLHHSSQLWRRWIYRHADVMIPFKTFCMTNPLMKTMWYGWKSRHKKASKWTLSWDCFVKVFFNHFWSVQMKKIITFNPPQYTIQYTVNQNRQFSSQQDVTFYYEKKSSHRSLRSRSLFDTIYM